MILFFNTFDVFNNNNETNISRDRIRMTSPSTSHAAGIDTVDSAEYLSRVSSSSSISGLGHAAMGHGHSGSLGSLPGLTHVSVHMKVWAALCSLETDPHPEVAKMCAVITGYVRGQLRVSFFFFFILGLLYKKN